MFDYIIASNNENKPKERITNMYAKWIYTSVLGNTVVVLVASPTGAPSLCTATSNETNRKIWRTLPAFSRNTPRAMVTNTSAPRMMTTSIIRPLVWNLSIEDFSDNIIMGCRWRSWRYNFFRNREENPLCCFFTNFLSFIHLFSESYCSDYCLIIERSYY